MTKREIQKRTLQNGKPLALSKFSWDHKTNTFSSEESFLVLDFTGINRCTFKTGSNCMFKTGCGCTFKTGSNCTFKTGSNCTFKTSYGCTFKTVSGCAFKTGSGCTFNTDYGCTFKTGSGCTFKTGSGCTFKTGIKCVIVRRDVFDLIQPSEGQCIQLCPYDISGYLIDGLLDGEPHIIADGILSRIIKQKGDVYRVINHNETKETYLIKQGDIYSHGDTLKEAKESLIYGNAD